MTKASLRDYREHINKLWPIYMDFAKRRGRWRYILHDEPFNDWSVHDRYANRNGFTRSNVEPHRAAARRICDMVDRANADLMP